VVIGSLEVGGAETHLLRVLPGVRAAGWSPVIYTLTHRGALAPDLERQGVVVLAPPFAAACRRLPRWFRGVLVLPVSAITLVALLVRHRIAVVHLFLPAAYLMGGICTWITGHRRTVMSRRSLNNYQSRHGILARVERWLHRRTMVILGNSRAVVEQLLVEGVQRQRLGLLYNGTNLAVRDRLSDRSAVCEELKLGTEPLILLLVANIIAYKGHADLIEALGRVKDDLPAGWILLCAGRDTGPGEALRRRAEELGLAGHVRWLGPRRDVARLVSAADVGLSCSHEEGFSNSVLECMAAGVPLVVTNVGGNPEAVEHGRSGIVVPPSDSGALAAAIVELGSNAPMRESMGMAARRCVEQSFSNEACVEKYVELYEWIAAEDARDPDLSKFPEWSNGW
jgi:glycosyltransferase involved in cell wall biosynthesis